MFKRLQPREPVSTVRDDILSLFCLDAGINYIDYTDYTAQHTSRSRLDFTPNYLGKVENRPSGSKQCFSNGLLSAKASPNPCQFTNSLESGSRSFTQNLLRDILDTLAASSRADSLDISYNPLLEKDSHLFVALIDEYPALFQQFRSISVSRSFKFSPKALKDFLASLTQHCKILETLHLSDCGLDDSCAGCLTEFLRMAGVHSIPLSKLWITNNDFTARGCRKLLDSRNTFCPALKILAHRNPAPEAMIARLEDACARKDGGTDTLDRSIEPLQLAPDVLTTNDNEGIDDAPLCSLYLDQTGRQFDAEFRKTIVASIKRLLPEVDESVLEDRSIMDLCMLCINVVQLQTPNLKSDNAPQEMHEFIML